MNPKSFNASIGINQEWKGYVNFNDSFRNTFIQFGNSIEPKIIYKNQRKGKGCLGKL